MTVAFGRATPILRVSDMDRAVRFYTECLGFERAWGDGGVTELRRGEAAVMLAQADQGGGKAWLYLGVDDVDALRDEIASTAAAIRNGPSNYPWGARELQVEDPDGNVIRFASEATDEPVGEWLDSASTSWRYGSDGSWTRAG